MRSTEILALFGYLYWIRDRVLAAAAQLSPDDFRSTRSVTSRDLRSTLVHELDVESSWRARLTGGAEVELDPANYPTIDPLVAHWQRDEAEMRRWLSSLTDAALAAPPPREREQRYPLWYYLVHVVSHGIQELEDAAVLLGPSGGSPWNVGFLDYADTTLAQD
jgi:uncharacterized damage-inducible protein DinB